MLSHKFTKFWLFSFLLVPFLLASPPVSYGGGSGEGPPPGAILGTPIIHAKMKIKVDKDDATKLNVEFDGRCADPTDPTKTVDFEFVPPQQMLTNAEDFSLASAQDIVDAINGMIVTDSDFTQILSPCWNGQTLPPKFVMFVHKVHKKKANKFKARVALLNFSTP